MEVKPDKIIQIIPAHGVEAVFLEDGKESAYPVVCWVLVEMMDDEDYELRQEVIGMTLCADFNVLVRVDHEGKFIRYQYSGD